MSKLTINKSISNFLNRNKIRLAALSTATIMATTMTACTINKVDTSVSKQQENLKDHVINCINNIEVYKNENVGGYYIHEELYEDAPGFTKDKNGNIIETDRNFIGYSQFFISFKEAEILDLTELLESKIKNKTK